MALAVAAVAAPTAAQAAPKAAVTMTFSVSPGPVAVGQAVTLSGRASRGKSGNAGPVELYFRTDKAARFIRIATTTAAADGSFRRTVTATASGTYQAVYRGNKYRNAASRTGHLAVYRTRTTTTTVWQYSGTDIECGPAANGCTITSGDLAIRPGPLTVSFARGCSQPKPAYVLAFTDDATNTPPADRTYPTAPGWRWFPYGVGPADFDLAPSTRHGHFYLHAGVAPYYGPGSPTTCNLTVTATQQITEKVAV